MHSRPVRFLITFLALASLALSSGCSVLHELKPNRLWRLNRHTAPRGGSNVYYSIPEKPIPDEVIARAQQEAARP